MNVIDPGDLNPPGGDPPDGIDYDALAACAPLPYGYSEDDRLDHRYTFDGIDYDALARDIDKDTL